MEYVYFLLLAPGLYVICLLLLLTYQVCMEYVYFLLLTYQVCMEYVYLLLTREGFLRKNIGAVSFFQNCAIHQYS